MIHGCTPSNILSLAVKKSKNEEIKGNPETACNKLPPMACNSSVSLYVPSLPVKTGHFTAPSGQCDKFTEPEQLRESTFSRNARCWSHGQAAKEAEKVHFDAVTTPLDGQN